MKKLFFAIGVLFFSFSVFSQETLTSINWEDTVYDFGEFKENDGKQKAKFVFTNTGDSPLYIVNVRASCGCTSSEYSREPIQPGAKGFVEAEYDPKNRPGQFNKSITVTSNSEPRVSVLQIKGNVIREM